MLRLLGPAELEGYVFRSAGGPRCELVSGLVSKIHLMKDAIAVSIQGCNLENGCEVCRTATVVFKDRGTDRKMLKTRLVAAGICKGTYLSVLSMQRNSERIALDYKFSGLWRFHGYKGEKNVLLGKYFDPIVQDTIVSIRFLDYNAARGRYYRRTVDIVDADMLPLAKDNFLYNTDRDACVCVCGPEERNGSMSVYRCFWYEMIDAAGAFI